MTATPILPTEYVDYVFISMCFVLDLTYIYDKEITHRLSL